MGPVRQNPIKRTVRTAHLSVLITVHNFSTRYSTEQLIISPLTSRQPSQLRCCLSEEKGVQTDTNRCHRKTLSHRICWWYYKLNSVNLSQSRHLQADVLYYSDMIIINIIIMPVLLITTLICCTNFDVPKT